VTILTPREVQSYVAGSVMTDTRNFAAISTGSDLMERGADARPATGKARSGALCDTVYRIEPGLLWRGATLWCAVNVGTPAMRMSITGGGAIVRSAIAAGGGRDRGYGALSAICRTNDL
jgi:hypothetical protein